MPPPPISHHLESRTFRHLKPLMHRYFRGETGRLHLHRPLAFLRPCRIVPPDYYIPLAAPWDEAEALVMGIRLDGGQAVPEIAQMGRE